MGSPVTLSTPTSTLFSDSVAQARTCTFT
jgi:hypothetical protein